MDVGKLREDILKFKEVILDIPIKHYYQQRYTNKIKQLFNSIFDDRLEEDYKISDLETNCPEKLEPLPERLPARARAKIKRTQGIM